MKCDFLKSLNINNINWNGSNAIWYTSSVLKTLDWYKKYAESSLFRCLFDEKRQMLDDAETLYIFFIIYM